MREQLSTSNLARNERLQGALELGANPANLLSDMPAPELASLLKFAHSINDVELLVEAGTMAREQSVAALPDDPSKKLYGVVATMASVFVDHQLREDCGPGYLLQTDIRRYRQLISLIDGD